MDEQLKLPIGKGTARVHPPIRELASAAKKWAEDRGQYYSSAGLGDLQVQHQTGFAVGRDYEKSMAAGGGDQERLRNSYASLRSETEEQYKHLTAPRESGGLGVSVEVTPHDPYENHGQMVDDFTNNRHLKVMSTETTGGHQFLTNDENDHFRAVHDVFGHLATGRGMSRHGEEAAFQHHSMMFSDKARPALASETRGQNSIMNYVRGGEFVDQTPGSPLIGLSDWADKRKASVPLHKEQFTPQGVQGSMF